MKTPTTATTLATLTAIASQSSATVVQISLDNNFLTSTVNQLTADFTGDGNADFVLSNITQVNSPPSPRSTFTYTSAGTTFSGYVPGAPGTYSAGVSINGERAFASAVFTSSGGISFSQSSIAGSQGYSGGVTILLPISFNDANYGGAINGWLQVNTSNFNPRIELSRIIWDENNLSVRPTGLSPFDAAFPTATPIPEMGSLALLALGAGGLLARRRRAA